MVYGRFEDDHGGSSTGAGDVRFTSCVNYGLMIGPRLSQEHQTLYVIYFYIALRETSI